MLTAIKPLQAAADKTETAAEMLLGCHQRIRYFTAVSARLADADPRVTAEIAEAAEAVHRYFTVALPLHEADENESLHPRLSGAGAPVAIASEEMVRQHAGIDALVAELVPIWDSLRQTPERLSEMAEGLRERSRRLQQLWEEHLSLEEQTVFPAMERCLSPAELDAIRNEMKLRRAQQL